MTTKRVVCFAGFLWEMLRTVAIFRLGAALLGPRRGFELVIILWCAVGQTVMPLGFFFLGLYPEKYEAYVKLLAVGKVAALLTGIVAVAASSGLLPAGLRLVEGGASPRFSVVAGFTFVLLLDALFLTLLLMYPRLRASGLARR